MALSPRVLLCSTDVSRQGCLVSGKRKSLFFVWGFGPQCSTVVQLFLPSDLFPHFFFAVVFSDSKFILLQSVALFPTTAVLSPHLTSFWVPDRLHHPHVWRCCTLAIFEALAGRYRVSCYEERKQDFGDFVKEGKKEQEELRGILR